MIICNKCGAHIDENLKYCDRCGSEIALNDEIAEPVQGLDDIKPLETEADASKMRGSKAYISKLIGMLPHPLGKKGDRTSLIIAVAASFILSFVYLICFFVFMSDMSLPIALGSFSKYAGDAINIIEGASPIWMIVYFVLNLFPLYFAIFAFFNKKYRFYSIFVYAFSILLTLISFISWGICDPASTVEAVGLYANAGSVAWFVLVDALSEVWYLKLLLAMAAVFGFGVDYITNEEV